ncbi:MAG TPA: class I SAM-dependent methyltransferase [Pyrinomonadaceae bacterium]|nr:class I SAM-dependent methyltransferase [Pyrinomonadaceae bacterium]
MQASNIKQAETDAKNITFWNELCGTELAKSLGVTDSTKNSLKKFDEFYFRFYPYLNHHIPFHKVKREKVLEVGLGYGSVSQRLAEIGAIYTGLDIAPGPVEMVNHRLRQMGLPGEAREGSIVDAPFPDGMFNGVVSIGCLHHTGNIQRALDEIHRVLQPGGWATVMIYNSYSYRRWWRHPGNTSRYFVWDYLGLCARAEPSAEECAEYDSSRNGVAPETVFTSARVLKRLSRRFSSIEIYKENADQEPFKNWRRENLLPWVGRFFGLDLYCRLIK